MNKAVIVGKRGPKKRGIEILRCGAQTPSVRLRGQGAGQEQDQACIILRPRRRTLGASPHSVGIYSHASFAHASFAHASFAHALCRRFIPAAAGLLLLLPAALRAAPQTVSKDAKDTVQVQTALLGAGSSHAETNLGDLVADAVRQTGSAQVALLPSDEIDGGASIPAGKTENSKIVAALHYASDPSDTVVVLTLTGAQLLQVAERSVSRAPQPFDGFLQVSGLQIRYDAKQPEGKRVSLVGTGGSEVSAGKAYRVAMTRSLAGGSLGYYQIWSAKDISDDTGVPLSKSLGSYLAAHTTINSVVEDRISSH